MYNFLTQYICNCHQDITIMSSQLDYFRLISKPKFKGDFMK